MPKLHRFSAKEIIQILKKFNFIVHSQRGSHIKLRRITESGGKQTLTIPDHIHLDTGTIKAIFRQACRYIPEDDLKNFFYSQ